ncbi:hypothetical protein GGX14DRAFT_401588 [Mycena pura]|uniref:Uncharacterized protein n=1 Tax=Mycena pura TaxID=153505 RepID=A0AAD6YA95_9AGAR|nr:hypothetical protein GGX14DRAFT_401588 [Mycena pura]
MPSPTVWTWMETRNGFYSLPKLQKYQLNYNPGNANDECEATRARGGMRVRRAWRQVYARRRVRGGAAGRAARHTYDLRRDEWRGSRVAHAPPCTACATASAVRRAFVAHVRRARRQPHAAAPACMRSGGAHTYGVRRVRQRRAAGSALPAVPAAQRMCGVRRAARAAAGSSVAHAPPCRGEHARVQHCAARVLRRLQACGGASGWLGSERPAQRSTRPAMRAMCGDGHARGTAHVRSGGEHAYGMRRGERRLAAQRTCTACAAAVPEHACAAVAAGGVGAGQCGYEHFEGGPRRGVHGRDHMGRVVTLRNRPKAGQGGPRRSEGAPAQTGGEGRLTGTWGGTHGSTGPRGGRGARERAVGDERAGTGDGAAGRRSRNMARARLSAVERTRGGARRAGASEALDADIITINVILGPTSATLPPPTSARAGRRTGVGDDGHKGGAARAGTSSHLPHGCRDARAARRGRAGASCAPDAEIVLTIIGNFFGFFSTMLIPTSAASPTATSARLGQPYRPVGATGYRALALAPDSMESRTLKLVKPVIVVISEP